MDDSTVLSSAKANNIYQQLRRAPASGTDPVEAREHATAQPVQTSRTELERRKWEHTWWTLWLMGSVTATGLIIHLLFLWRSVRKSLKQANVQSRREPLLVKSSDSVSPFAPEVAAVVVPQAASERDRWKRKTHRRKGSATGEKVEFLKKEGPIKPDRMQPRRLNSGPPFPYMPGMPPPPPPGMMLRPGMLYGPPPPMYYGPMMPVPGMPDPGRNGEPEEPLPSSDTASRQS
ncbi:MAG: hypothetical protein Q7Q73_07855 [Verrucomicrobiota bacterium JB024]|nr:hypothetical protein [Verrucomicrobiota bacterium JB024]